jgi:predicted nucleic acid-binding protein
VIVKFGLDTSCIVSLLSAGHALHLTTRQAYAMRRDHAEQPVIPVHAILETFSVLTRSPAPLFVPPAQVREMLIENFFEVAEIPDVTANRCWAALDVLSARSIGGGLLYDAIIAQSCYEAGAKLLLTWNVRDFLRVAPPALEIRQPTV